MKAIGKCRSPMIGLLVTASVIASLGSSAALAQSASAAEDSDGTGNFDIVVTAQRRQESTLDVGMPISVLAADSLQERNVTGPDDLQKLVPGLAVSDTGFNGRYYTLRGIGVSDPSLGANSSVAIYFDEVPMSFTAMAAGPIYDLQRVEVLKGPQGTLYGQNSTAGAINYITNAPTEDFSAGATASYGRFDAVTAEGYISGSLAPNLRGRLAFSTVQQGPWQKSMTRDEELGSVHRTGARLSLDWDAADDLRIKIGASGWWDNSDIAGSRLIAVQPARPADALPAVINAPLALDSSRQTDWDIGTTPGRNDHFLLGSIRADWNVSDNLTFTSLTAYSKLRQDYTFDPDGLALQENLSSVEGKIDSFTQEVRLAATFDKVRLIVGANYSHAITDENTFQQTDAASQNRNLLGFKITGTRIFSHQKVENAAAFANVDIDVLDQVSLTAGIRYSEDKRSFRGCTADTGDGSQIGPISLSRFLQKTAAGLDPLGGPPLVPGGCMTLDENFDPVLFKATLKEHNVPWDVTLNWKPNSDTLVYARVSKGYKAGNFAAIPASTVRTLYPIHQENVLDYEIGVKARISHWLLVEADLFKYDYNNKQLRSRILDPVFGLINAQINIPKSSAKGGELSVTVRPLPDLTLSAAGVYLKTRIDEFMGYNTSGLPINGEGLPFNFSPKYTLNASVDYSPQINDRHKLLFGVDWSYRSHTPSAIASLPLLEIDGYHLLDARVGISSIDDKWKAWVFGKNITNTQYWSNSLKALDYVVRFAGMPTTYGVAASYKF